MKRFFQIMSEFLKYGAAFIAGGFYIWTIIFLLNNDNWIGIYTLTTMLLAIAAFWAIWQNYSFRKEEKKERLLNEIIEWAEDVAKIGVEANFRDILEITSTEAGEMPFAAHMAELSLRFKAMNGENQYISEISLTFGQDLQKAVEELIKEIQSHIELLIQCRRDVFTKSKNESADKVNEHKMMLDKLVKKVIEEATTIKTKDVS